jgi:Spy/CpxP family protein refolding chaperone
MTKTMRGPILAAVLLLMAVGSVAAQQTQPRQNQPRRPQPAPFGQPQPFAWWKSEPFKKELGLTADQSAHIDKIWETTRPELRQEWDELSRLEEKLSHLIQNDADEAVLARQIDRVETARANTNKTRSLMLVQMLKTLTPDQRSHFKALNDRWQQDLQRHPPADPRKPRED